MSVYKINNILSNEEINSLKESIKKIEGPLVDGTGNDPRLGRYITGLKSRTIPQTALDKINKIISDNLGYSLSLTGVTYVEYSSQYGEPSLPPHLDADKNDLSIDYQIDSNICWELGIDTEIYPLEDNSALMFNANEHVHWRPKRVFNEGEYVKMLIFRFCDTDNKTDYSHVRLSSDDIAFRQAYDFRNSLA